MPTTKDIESPEKLKEFFIEYKQHQIDNPIEVVEQMKTRVQIPRGFEGNIEDLVVISIPKKRALTMEGFENFVARKGFCEAGLAQYFSNRQDRYTEYVPICSYIRREIRQDQIEGGMSGIYNPSITQRLNGLTDKSEVNVVAEQPLFTKPKEDE